MKKVLSVALASAMVLGMGANAFAIQYSTGSNEKADWPKNFQFDGQLFVTNADGDIITESTTALNSEEDVDFEPGDVIWMPLYADNQKVYDVEGNQTGYDKVAATTVSLPATLDAAIEGEVQVDKDGTIHPFTYADKVNKVVYYYNQVAPSVDEGWRTAEIKNVKLSAKDFVETTDVAETKDATLPVKVTISNSGVVEFGIGYEYSAAILTEGESVSLAADFVKDSNGQYVNNATSYKTVTFDEIKNRLGANNLTDGHKGTVTIADAYTTTSYKDVVKAGVKVVASLPEVAEIKEDLGDIVNSNDEITGNDFVNTVAYGHYTGNIDKNWSINLIEKSEGVAELIANAELYKATKADYLSYKGATSEIQPNAVYLKITLEDEWKTVDEETLKYYVYIADNSNKNNKTNEVWVSGTYANNDWEYVDFTWTNNAAEAQLWKVKKGENGTAVFDFADKAFFTVKMYSGESMYLDLSTAYDKAIAGEMDAEADSFYKFDNENANFSRTGELIIVTDDETLVPYEIDEDGNFVEVDAKYVENYAIAHTNKKVDGFVFSTKTLGNYVLSTEKLGQEEQPAEETPAKPVTPSEPTQETPAPETSKPNPDTGAEDFVGLAVSLAVVSVAAAGALALKK